MSKNKKLVVPSGLLFLPLVGNYYRPASAQAMMRKAVDGDLVFLKRDPFNPKDSQAIKVLSANPDGRVLTLLGFVQRHIASRLSNFLAEDKSFDNTDYVLALVKTCASTEFEMTPFGVTDAGGVVRALEHHTVDRSSFETIVNKLRAAA